MANERYGVYAEILGSFQRHGSLTAIVDKQGNCTYAELENLSRNIAWHLERAGVQAGDMVPIITQGGRDMIAAMIAAMQLAAPFVPIDADSPATRSRNMIGSLNAKAAVIDRNLNPGTMVPGGVPTISVGGDGQSTQSATVAPDTILYGFFTSGSTGKPKCCLNKCEGLLNRFAFNQMVKPLVPGEKVLQNSKHTFDPVLWQTLWPLTKGATVVVPDRKGLLDIDETIQIIKDHGVVMTDIVPSVLAVLLDYFERDPSRVENVETLEHIFVGGEEISADMVNKSRRLIPNALLTNTYGPTEATIGMIYHHFDQDLKDPVPLGVAIPGAFYSIVDEQLDQVRDGEVGQLVIGGKCLGAGYLNEPELTDKGFRVLEINGRSERVFLTGDRAVVSDGIAYFKGRADKQIKVRGVRVELKEIESVMEMLPAVRVAKVIPVNNGPAGLSLVGFFTAVEDVASDVLRSHIRDHLPKEFIPSSFKKLNDFPVTTAGKVDRKRLAAMAIETTTHSEASNKDLIVNIVNKYLDIDEIGENDNVFDAGLNSLSAIRVTLELGDALGVHVETAALYETPTIAGLNKVVGGVGSEGTGRTAEAIDLGVWRDVVFESRPEIRNALLTGATGYLGIYLLRELSHNRNGTITCLVRAADDGQGMLRLHQSALAFGLHNEIKWDNVRAVAADMSLAGFGLSGSYWRRIAGGIRDIYHAGADVNFLKPLSELQAANVESTLTLSEFANMNGDCHVHYMSSIAVLAAANFAENGGDGELRPSLVSHMPVGGYALSKLASELVIENFVQSGGKATIYRLGELMPSDEHPYPNPRSNVTALLSTFVDVGGVFDGDESLDYTEIDSVARLIASHGSNTDKNGMVLNLSCPHRVKMEDLRRALSDVCGADFSTYSKAEFYRSVRELCLADGVERHNLIVWDQIKDQENAPHWGLLQANEGQLSFATSVDIWRAQSRKTLRKALKGFRPVAQQNVQKRIIPVG